MNLRNSSLTPLKTAAAVLTLTIAGAAVAQDKPDPAKFLAAAFKLRRDGSFDAAAAFFDEALRVLPQKSDDRRVVGFEAYELALVQGKFEKAAREIRGVDHGEELCALARTPGKADQALKLAREAKDVLAEAKVLKLLGKDDEAQQAFAKLGPSGAIERGELLMKLGRFDEAARTFDQAGEVLRRALALDKMKDPVAGTAMESAKIEQKGRLEGILARAKEAKAKVDAPAADSVAKDRNRYALAEVYSKLSDAYDRYSIVHEKTNEKPKAQKLAELALQFANQERQFMTDGGTDKYGVALAKWKKLDERDKRLSDRVAALK
jgi:tetratricopeptide (TPR) repeat protein